MEKKWCRQSYLPPKKKAAAFNDIELVDNLENADVVHINTIFPKSYELAKEAHKLGKKSCLPRTLYKTGF